MASTGIDWVKVYSGYSDRLRETPGEKGTFEGVGGAASLGGGGGHGNGRIQAVGGQYNTLLERLRRHNFARVTFPGQALRYQK